MATMRHSTASALFLATVLTACGGSSSDETAAPPASAELSSEPPAASPAPAVQPESAGPDAMEPFELRNLARDGQAASVSVSYAPGISEFDPRLARQIAESSETMLETFEEEAGSMGAGQGGSAPPHSLGINWRVTYRGEAVISLVREMSYYTGGAHPNADISTLVWDRTRGKALAAADLFGSEDVAYRVLMAPLRERLTEARAARNDMGGLALDDLRLDVEDAVNREAGSLDRLGIATGDADRPGLVVFFPPYEVASYAEGSYVITLPADLFQEAVADTYAGIFARR